MRVAVGSRPARERAGIICGAGNGQWPTGAPGDDGADLPSSDDSVYDPVGVAGKLLAVAEGQVVNRIGRDDMGSIVVARRPLCPLIIDILPVSRCAHGVVPCSVITSAVRHALGVGIRQLELATRGSSASAVRLAMSCTP